MNRRLAVILATTMTAGLLAAPRAQAEPTWNPARPAPATPAPGRDAGYRPAPAPKRAPLTPRAVTWPRPGTADVTLTVPDRARTGERVTTQAGSLPIWVSGTQGRVRAELADRSVTGPGLLFRLTPSGGAGRVGVEADYSAFRQAIGGDWANRLRLVRLPACAWTTPARADCRTQTPLGSQNRAGRVTAEVDLGSHAVLALTAGPSGATGSFAATSLSPSATWQVSTQTGDFAWSYPLRMPPSLGGPVPQVTLGYSSGSVDGRTASTNNQPSWIGEGFDFSAGFIERKYRSCSDDVTFTPKPVDLCWRYDNATLSLNTGGGELVLDDTDHKWHAKNDSGMRIEKLTGVANGDRFQEYWKVTTHDGMRYFFGSRPAAGSTWTVPVFGDDAGEPCHGATFAASSCDRAWRWNLDYVVDPQGNAMTYHYQPEINYYGRNLQSSGARYHRGGHLKKIEYGLRDGVASSAPAQVTFGTAERCFPSGAITCSDAQFVPANAVHWPDVPVDQNCAAGASCAGKHAPTFWTRKRLTAVTTQVWNGTTHTDVDRWDLLQEMRDPGDGTSKGLWLREIKHTGLGGGQPIALPEVTFDGYQYPNRVDAIDAAAAMQKWRITSITSESGGVLSVNYLPPECRPGSNMPASEDNNTKRCFPTYWTPEGASDPTLDWFHKYPVASVAADGRTPGSLPIETTYSYLGSPAWHHDDDDGLVDPQYKTWSQWRGYEKVRVITGRALAPQTITEHLYLRGMHGDKLKSGGSRTVSVTDSEGGTIPDDPALQGFVREQITYDGSAQVSGVINDPWRRRTARRVQPWGANEAHMVNTYVTRSRTAVVGGGLRRTKTTSHFDDASGLVIRVDDEGDVATTDDERCTRTTHVTNATTWMINFPSRVETVSVSCTATPRRPDDVVSDVRTRYDGQAYGAAPTRGNVTASETISGWATGPVYLTDARHDYDDYGRVKASYDASNNKTTTSYSHVSGGLVNKVTVTNPAGHVVTTEYAPAWAARLAVIDPNGKRTSVAYDALGRLTKIWMAGRAAPQSPHTEFSYLVDRGRPAAVTTRELRGDGSSYTTGVALFDGLLRPVQSQSDAPNGGRVVSSSFYDARGLTAKTHQPYFTTGAPSTTFFEVAADTYVPGSNVLTHDGAGRVVRDQFRQWAQDKWATTTTYSGDRVHVVPPSGAAPTTTITDAHGRVTEVRRHRGPLPGDPHDATAYGYDHADRLTTVRDAAGNVWRYGYDLRGRKIHTDDPDKGATTFGYDDLDRLTSVTDSRGVRLVYGYDVLGRRISSRRDSPTGPLLAEWTHDTVARGLPVKSTRYVGGHAYVSEVTGYDNAYRPTGTRTTIPASEGFGPAGVTTPTSFASTLTYNHDGSLATQAMPAAGGLAAETMRYSYNDLGMPTITRGQSTYVIGTTYTGIGQIQTQVMATTSGRRVQRQYSYEPGTNRLSTVISDREGASPYRIGSSGYAYDPAGNVTKITDGPDIQCFRYDHQRRLTEAWTPAVDDCAPDPALLGGPSPYWNSYSYDAVGNRRQEVRHSPSGDVSRSYAYPAAGSAQPHALRSVTTTGPGGSQQDTYDYHPDGALSTRTIAGVGQSLEWDAEGQLSKVTEGTKVTSFVYDADGNRLIRREPDATTLYLGAMELRRASGTVSATRYYTHGGATVAIRTTAGVQFLLSDHHGTADLAVDAATNTVTRRRFDPFGNPRGPAPGSWPGERGFVGGVQDTSTGLTHLGARDYDPAIGRFISVDPVMDVADPQQMHGYAYGNSNPVTLNDASGLKPCGDDDCQLTATPKQGGGYTVHDNRRSAPSRCPNAPDWLCQYVGSLTGDPTPPPPSSPPPAPRDYCCDRYIEDLTGEPPPPKRPLLEDILRMLMGDPPPPRDRYRPDHRIQPGICAEVGDWCDALGIPGKRPLPRPRVIVLPDDQPDGPRCSGWLCGAANVLSAASFLISFCPASVCLVASGVTGLLSGVAFFAAGDSEAALFKALSTGGALLVGRFAPRGAADWLKFTSRAYDNRAIMVLVKGSSGGALSYLLTGVPLCGISYGCADPATGAIVREWLASLTS